MLGRGGRAATPYGASGRPPCPYRLIGVFLSFSSAFTIHKLVIVSKAGLAYLHYSHVSSGLKLPAHLSGTDELGQQTVVAPVRGAPCRPRLQDGPFASAARSRTAIVVGRFRILPDRARLPDMPGGIKASSAHAVGLRLLRVSCGRLRSPRRL